MNNNDYDTEYRYVMTNKDCERVQRLIVYWAMPSMNYLRQENSLEIL